MSTLPSEKNKETALLELRAERQVSTIRSAVERGKIVSSIDTRVTTMTTILRNKELLPIATLRKTNEGELIIYISALVEEACGFVKGNGMERQATSMALMLMDEYYFFRPEEIGLVLRRGIMGHYGQKYEGAGVDSKDLFGWVRDYAGERATWFEREMHNHSFKQIDKEKENAEKMDDSVAKKMRELSMKFRFSDQKVGDKVFDATTDKMQKVIQDWIREFDKLEREQNRGKAIGQFIAYTVVRKGKRVHTNVNIDDFLLAKMDELKEENSKIKTA